MKTKIFLAVLLLAACSKPQKQAVAVLEAKSGSSVAGTVTFTEQKEGVLVQAEAHGLTPGLHGFHIHEKGDCSADDASSAGEHFNPDSKEHGAPANEHHHAGDFGNVVVDENGNGKYERVLSFISLQDGKRSVLNRSILIHANPDDLTTQPSGNSGARVACGVIKLK